MSDQFYLVENLGGGAALFDYDNDGDLDLYLVQGRMLGEGKPLADARFPPKAGVPLHGVLYRNDLTIGPGGRPQVQLVDVTQASGLQADGYGMGVTTGDYDNDGRVDLFLTNLGASQLWHNNGDGTFTDVTAKAGVGESRLAISAAFLDYDRDGWLDLYVAEYVDFTTANNKPCHAPSSARDYCSPKVYEPLPDRLYPQQRRRDLHATGRGVSGASQAVSRPVQGDRARRGGGRLQRRRLAGRLCGKRRYGQLSVGQSAGRDLPRRWAHLWHRGQFCRHGGGEHGRGCL